MVPALIVTKYHVPPAGPNPVQRGRLLDQLRRGLAGKCTLISAPPGFGKSTLAAELARQSGPFVAWLSLDRGDNDPVRFGAYLVEAIRTSGLPFDEPMQSLVRMAEQPPLEALAAILLNAVAAAGVHFLLVLDDYHLIEAGEIHAAIANLLDRLPPNFHLVIATRMRPPLPLARLKARGELAEITATDLRFTPGEAAGFLREAMGVPLPDAGVTALMDRTEGWITGLKLAALSLGSTDDWASAIKRFTGNHPDLLNYLVDEVIERQPEAVRRFLRCTAILDRLSGPLCDAVTGQPDGHQILQRLEQANLFILPLDTDRQWYRYHPLFAEFLLTRLHDAAEEPEIALLHRRAAGWHREHGEFGAAIEHLLTAQGFAEAADALEADFADWSSRVSPQTLRRWVGQMPKAVMQQRPRLCTMAAWVLISSSDDLPDHLFNETVDYLAMASHALASADDSRPDVRESLGVVAAVRTALASWAPLLQSPACILQGVAHAVSCANEARSLLPGDSLFWRSVVSSSLGQVYLRAGDLPGAAQAFGEAGRLGSRSTNLTATVAALHRQGQLLRILGQPRSADAAYREALRLAAARGGDALPALAPVYLGLGALQYERNDLTGAEASIGEARKRYEAGGLAAPEALLAMARVRQARGDARGARLLVDQAGELLEQRARLRAATAAVWPDGVRILLAQGDVAAARRWVNVRGVSSDREVVLWRAAEYLALARLLIAEGEAESALPLLRSLRSVALAGGGRGVEAEICLVEALALHATHATTAARASVQATLAAVTPDDSVRLFADEGRPILALLGQLNGELRRGRHADLPNREYVPGLLATLAEAQAATAPVGPGPRPEPGPDPAAPLLVEPLTEREREIVRLIASGCSNQDVARALFVGVSTVKWHLLNIYGKLQVQNRTQAVAHARQLGLV